MARFLWGLFLILSFLITLPASWWLLAKTDFAYGYWYDTINIAGHIERYAPYNIKQKLHFEKTSKQERTDLFHQVVVAIQNNGEGLEALQYQDKTTQQAIQLFTQAEITHLEDVAHLLSKLTVLSFALLVLWLMIATILWMKKIRLPNTKQMLLSTVLILLLVGATLLIGPEAIFNQLHIWVFPDNHQWFFYYEESLMSTMMKAPDLFAYIAASWGAVSLLLTIVLLVVLNGLLGAKTYKKRGGVL